MKIGRNEGVKYPAGFQLPDDARVRDILALCRDAGMNLIDTAPAYGSSEERLGALLTQRQDWVIRMLAIPYLGAIRPELAGAGKTSRTPGPIAGSADDTAGAATSVVDDAAKGLPPRGVRPTDTPIPEGHTRVFRAVGEDEYQDIISKRQLREGPNSLEGKLFADSLDGAIDHGCALFPNGKFRLIEVDIPNDTPSLFRQPNLDGRGPARFVHNDDLPALSPRPLE